MLGILRKSFSGEKEERDGSIDTVKSECPDQKVVGKRQWSDENVSIGNVTSVSNKRKKKLSCETAVNEDDDSSSESVSNSTSVKEAASPTKAKK